MLPEMPTNSIKKATDVLLGVKTDCKPLFSRSTKRTKKDGNSFATVLPSISKNMA